MLHETKRSLDEALTGAGPIEPQREALIPFARTVIHELSKVLVERGESYQDYEDNAHAHVGMMNVLFDQPRFVTGWRKWSWAEGAMMQITSKLSRVAMQDGELHRDNWLDIAGYAIIATAILDRQQGRGRPQDGQYEECVATQSDVPAPRLPTNEQLRSDLIFDFSSAVDVMKTGRAVRRAAWDPKDCIWMEDKANVEPPVIVCRAGFGATQWMGSVSDFTALDWQLY